MAVVVIGFGGMAWFSFGLPWSKPAPQAEAKPVQQAVPAPVAQMPVPAPVVQVPAPVAAAKAPDQPFKPDVEPENLKDDATAQAMKAIQGEWEFVVCEIGGRTVEPKHKNVTIKGNTLGGKQSDKVMDFVIDASTGSCDLSLREKSGNLKDSIGIYKLDGDILKMCYRYNVDGKAARPTGFKSDEDKPNISVFNTFKRVEPQKLSDPVAEKSKEPTTHWKFWDVFGKGAKKESLIVSRDGMLLSPAHEQAFCLTSAKEYSGLEFKLEFQFQTADGLANPYVGVVSTLPNPAASDWKQQIPRSVQIKLDPKVAGELVLPTADFKVKLNEAQKIHNARHIAPINKAEVKLREWNTLEVKCSEDSKLIVKINGVTVNRLEGMQSNKGHVVLWPANAEMRLRNAVVAVDGSETKLSFETLE